jgi:hypothetical protein
MKARGTSVEKKIRPMSRDPQSGKKNVNPQTHEEPSNRDGNSIVGLKIFIWLKNNRFAVASGVLEVTSALEDTT